MIHEASPTAGPAINEAIGVLHRVLREETRFVKVHAAEVMIDVGHPDGVHDTFAQEEEKNRHEPAYRIGIWRVLSRCSPDDDNRRRWAAAIRDAALDLNAPDRIGAIESLAKLKYPIAPAERGAFEAAVASDQSGPALFANWALAAASGEDRQEPVARYLDSDDAVARLRAGFILRHLPNLSPDTRHKLRAAARAERPDTNTYAYLTSSSFILAELHGDAEEAQRCRRELLRIAQTREPGEKQEACRAFIDHGTAADLAWLHPLLKDASPAVDVAAALASIRIQQRCQARANTR